MSPIQQMLLGASGAEETYWIRELSSASNTTSSENAQKYKFASARLGADGKTLFAMYNTWFQRSGDNYWLPSVYNVKLNLKGDLQHFRRFYFNNYPYFWMIMARYFKAIFCICNMLEVKFFNFESV